MTFCDKNDKYHFFLDNRTFEEHKISNELISKQGKYLKSGESYTISSCNGVYFDVFVPRLATMIVTFVNNGIATVENGMKFAVPSRVKPNDEIRIDTLTDEFYD